MKKLTTLLIALSIVLGLSLHSHASLIIRGTDTLGNQLIYDDDLGITWYDYSNAANSWDNQTAWAGALTVDFGGTVYSDWRLPTALNSDGTGPCLGYDCTGSEMGHLYYTELGNAALGPLANTGDLQNLLSAGYWSSTFWATYTGSILTAWGGWDFNFFDGYQNEALEGFNLYALAVRDGDVAAAAVPEPSTLLLIGSGLVGLGFVRRKFKR